MLWQTYTPAELSRFDGSSEQDKRILMGVQGRVFDVTASAGFYGPGGPYENFAGRDASRGLALQSFDADVLTPTDQPLDTLQDLTQAQKENLQGWLEMYANKYTECGEIRNPPLK
ncbi:uncharacterized protein L969DRAFT_94801 [Mixia osmundae IAM 14324]|uniref:Cytochrome b5 heme-binding domain-containing protein n=1 Tax=Mixia osmundae (strain CBS 9802 / IAM 14324 / JCM 22182 / KY 12970) TaxID=764103 RepID=G7E4A3_MIXOS|nr:uncharacterized protein L969DRAFT_94801 [Mixia osmundae IAM 14324]KEI39760.1 hypothetical protein L969DRAFT_94801 [Mixia osmundae IAM 14324]GAA97663.1 hypothetical protein E5Q_04341 [Mixia osmundae IAM 14324]